MDPDEFFANKEMTFEEMLSKMYRIKDFDIQVHQALLGFKKPVKCGKVQDELENETVAVYRSLQKLTKAGLCKKEKRLLKGGGHYMVYSHISFHNARDSLLDKMEHWYEQAKRIAENR